MGGSETGDVPIDEPGSVILTGIGAEDVEAVLSGEVQDVCAPGSSELVGCGDALGELSDEAELVEEGLSAHPVLQSFVEQVSLLFRQCRHGFSFSVTVSRLTSVSRVPPVYQVGGELMLVTLLTPGDYNRLQL